MNLQITSLGSAPFGFQSPATVSDLSRYGKRSSGRLIKRKHSVKPMISAADRKNLDPQINRHEVLIEWNKLSNFPAQALREQFTKLIQLCKYTEKDELVIANIAPSFRVGAGNIDEIHTIQNHIVSTLLNVVASFQQSKPETRLSLRRGEFDIRVYLGNTFPRDLICKDDR